MSVLKEFYLTRAHTLDYLVKLSRRGYASTLYLAPGMTSESVASHLRAALPDPAPKALVDIAQSSATGVCVFSGAELTLIVPPFPVKERAVFTGCETSPLQSVLREDRTIAFVLVRLGMYAIGVSRGEQLVDGKVGTGLIHSRHRQGGSSANRFRRRRVDQIDHFLGRVCEKVKEHIGVHLEEVEFLAYGGAWTTIELLKKACPILSRLEEHQLPPLLDIGEPKQAILEASVRRVWCSRVMEWQKEELVS